MRDVCSLFTQVKHCNDAPLRPKKQEVFCHGGDRLLDMKDEMTVAQAHLKTRMEENPEAMLQCSRSYVPKDTKDIFALRTRSTIHHEGKYLKEGSFVIVDPKDRVLADGRLMVFSVCGEWHLRGCHIEEGRVWLQSKAGKPPIILTISDADEHVVGFASMLIPLPSF